jgi:uncharacterized membrane protein YedE/YeeE
MIPALMYRQTSTLMHKFLLQFLLLRALWRDAVIKNNSSFTDLLIFVRAINGQIGYKWKNILIIIIKLIPMNRLRNFPPVLSGVLIGLSMVAAFVIAGRGIGASGFLTRLVATVQNQLMPTVTEKSVYFARYFSTDKHPLDTWLTYFAIGLVLGSLVLALISRNWKLEVLRGDRITSSGRLLLALLGGGFIGFAARLARGCTSGQALVGGAELLVGAWAFMICIFAGGYLVAYLVRKQWI